MQAALRGGNGTARCLELVCTRIHAVEHGLTRGHRILQPLDVCHPVAARTGEHLPRVGDSLGEALAVIVVREAEPVEVAHVPGVAAVRAQRQVHVVRAGDRLWQHGRHRLVRAPVGSRLEHRHRGHRVAVAAVEANLHAVVPSAARGVVDIAHRELVLARGTEVEALVQQPIAVMGVAHVGKLLAVGILAALGLEAAAAPVVAALRLDLAHRGILGLGEAEPVEVRHVPGVAAVRAHDRVHVVHPGDARGHIHARLAVDVPVIRRRRQGDRGHGLAVAPVQIELHAAVGSAAVGVVDVAHRELRSTRGAEVAAGELEPAAIVGTADVADIRAARVVAARLRLEGAAAPVVLALRLDRVVGAPLRGRRGAGLRRRDGILERL